MLKEKLELVLRMGDNALVLSQRLCAWVGKGPALEEDMALANTALDLIGQARLWLAYAADIEGKGRTEDEIAYKRDSHEFRNLLIVERPNGSYADTLVRQYLFDSWHILALDQLSRSKDEQIAAIASKSTKEVIYHLRRSSDLIVRLGDGSEESRVRIQDAIDNLWSYTGEMFAADEYDRAAVESGLVGAPVSDLRAAWLAQVTSTLTAGTLKAPDAGSWMHSGGKSGRHTEDLGYLLAEMQFLQRAYPGLQW